MWCVEADCSESWTTTPFSSLRFVTALIECGMCVPSNYTGFYIKCNLFRKIKKLATNLPAVIGSRPLCHNSIVRPNNLPGLTVLYSVTANNLPGHNTTSCRLTQIIYTTHTWYRRQTHVRTLSNPATTPPHSRSRRQWRDPVGSPKVNDDLY